MILVSGKVCFCQADLEPVRPAMAAMVNASLAEDGCIDYAYSIDVNRWR